MKKSHATKSNAQAVASHRSFRRLIRKFFASLIKRQICDGQHALQVEVLDKLQDIEDLIEIMARQMARQFVCGRP